MHSSRACFMWLDDARLTDRHTFALRSFATAYAEASDEEGARALLATAKARRLQVIPIGEGSNFLPGARLHALCLRYTDDRVRVLERDSSATRLAVGAGLNWHRFVTYCLEAGFHGLENLALIPGTVGAAPIQNIGAYGVEVGPCIERVHAIRLGDGRSVILGPDDCAFAYRDSAFKTRWRDRLLITRVDFLLRHGVPPVTDYPSLTAHLGTRTSTATPREVFDAVVTLRRERLPDPLRAPNAGSFFKNPVVHESQAAALRTCEPAMPVFPAGPGRCKLAAGWLIERCGWKGRRVGAIRVHPRHALVLVNEGGAELTDLLAVARAIAADVAERFAVALELEPRCYGEGRG